MINESDGRQDSQDDEKVDDSPDDPMLGQFEGVIGGAIEKAVSQYRALLQQGLETEVKRIVTDFEVATTDVDHTVARRTRSRLSELIEGEVRAVFDDTLGEAEETFADPIWRTARDRHIPYLAPEKSASTNEASAPPSPAPEHPVDHDRVSQPEAPESEHDNGEGPKSIAPPSPNFWVFPSDQQMRIRVQEEPDQDDSSADAFADPQQQPTANEDVNTDAISAVVADNSDLQTVIHDNADIVHIALNENDDQEFQDSFDPGPPSDFDDEELMVAASMEFDDFEEPEWDLQDGLFETSDDWNTSDPIISEEIETPEAVVAESDEEAASEYQELETTPAEETVEVLEEDVNAESIVAVEDEAADSSVDDLEAFNPAADPVEEKLVPTDEQAVEEEPAELAAPADVIEAEQVESQTEAVASVADEASLKADEPVEPAAPASVIEFEQVESQTEAAASVVDESALNVDDPDKIVSDVGGDVEKLAEQSQELVVNDFSSQLKGLSEQSEPLDEQTTVFEGTVRLNVEAPGCVKEIVIFIGELRRKPQLRLLRLVSNQKEGVDIWLGLREPLNLGTILPEMQGVTIVSKYLEHVGGPDERLLSVRLIRDNVSQKSDALLPAESMTVENSKVVA